MEDFNAGDSVVSSAFREKLNELIARAYRPIRGPGVTDTDGYVFINPYIPQQQAASGGTAGVFPVLVGTDGGSPGGSAANCSFTYNCTDLNGIFIAGTQTPERVRMGSVAYLPAGEGGRSEYAIAMYGTSSNFKLLQCFGEIQDTTTCGTAA